MNLDEYTQSEKTYTYKKANFDNKKEPWSAMYFETKPSKLELLGLSNNTTFRRENIIRIISHPLPFKSIYMRGEYICSSTLSEFHSVITDSKGNKKPVGRDMFDFVYQQNMKEKAIMAKKKDSSGNKAYSEDDIEEYWETKCKPLRSRAQYAFEILDNKYYHYVDVPGSSYPDLVDCVDEEDCEYCSRDLERNFGGRKVWKVSNALWKELIALQETIKWQSVSSDPELCGHKLSLSNLSHISCSGCEYRLAEGDAVRSKCKTKPQFEAEMKVRDTCPECQHRDHPKQNFEIEGKAVGRASLLDVDIQVSVTGTKIVTNGFARVKSGTMNTGLNKVNSISLRPNWVEYPDDSGVYSKDGEELKARPLDEYIRPSGQKEDGKKMMPYKGNYDTSEEYVQEILAAQARLLGTSVPEEYKITGFEEIPF